jgi:hypothetical protein
VAARRRIDMAIAEPNIEDLSAAEVRAALAGLADERWRLVRTADVASLRKLKRPGAPSAGRRGN